MAVGVPTETLLVVAGVVAFGGLIKGVAGFGYGVASTAILATVLSPTTAVVVMILPALAANASLMGELDGEGLRSCITRFWPYLGAALVGTLLGMAVLDAIPRGPLALALGTLTLGYVLLKQPYVALPGADRAAAVCLRPGGGVKASLGFVSGVVFGASNVGVQVVAYLDTLDLDRSTFVGVLAMVLVGISMVRVVTAFALGLYGGSALPLSVAAVVPGLVGVRLGTSVRRFVPERAQTRGTLALLAVIGARLTATGFGL
jgi:uncharacterized membrane protein YfcA